MPFLDNFVRKRAYNIFSVLSWVVISRDSSFSSVGHFLRVIRLTRLKGFLLCLTNIVAVGKAHVVLFTFEDLGLVREQFKCKCLGNTVLVFFHSCLQN